jgi:prepilin-type N-terminal cleavage/methylation domain-containing protein
MDLKNLTKKLKNTKGFTFIELIVVMGIFAIISSVVLFSSRDFTSDIDLQNLAQKIALQASNMQRNALSGVQPNFFPDGANGAGSRWNPAYGLCFSTANDCQGDASPTNFVLFADDLNNNRYTTDEDIDIIQILGGEVVSSICARVGGSNNCGQTSVDIVYTRPKTGPEITYGGQSAESATVTIQSETGETSDIVFWKTGQVEVQ